MSRPAGRPPCRLKKAYAERYKISPRRASLAVKKADQLELCKDDIARRLLLGVSRKGRAA